MNTKIKLINGDDAQIFDSPKIKILNSPNYNFYFDKRSGFFARWGKTKEDDGDLNLGMPEIADIEIAEICEGVPGIGPCAFCYKNNTAFKGINMSLETFKNIYHKLPPTVGQIAFGCGTLRLHPEMWDIFRYAKENEIVPKDVEHVLVDENGKEYPIKMPGFNNPNYKLKNIYIPVKGVGTIPNLTINGDVDEHEFDKIAELCGACACSVYNAPNLKYSMDKTRKIKLKRRKK